MINGKSVIHMVSFSVIDTRHMGLLNSFVFVQFTLCVGIRFVPCFNLKKRVILYILLY